MSADEFDVIGAFGAEVVKPKPPAKPAKKTSRPAKKASKPASKPVTPITEIKILDEDILFARIMAQTPTKTGALSMKKWFKRPSGRSRTAELSVLVKIFRELMREGYI